MHALEVAAAAAACVDVIEEFFLICYVLLVPEEAMRTDADAAAAVGTDVIECEMLWDRFV